MHSFYLITAVAGCTLLMIQLVLQVIGVMGDADIGNGHGVDADHGDAHDHTGHGNVFFKVLSIRALSAFCALFGLTGLALENQGFGSSTQVAGAMGGGVVGLVLVLWLMSLFSKLTASGTVNIRNAVGKTGSVYLRIPSKGEGSGKVTVEVQGRSLELQAVTDGDEIATGAQVMVADVIGDETLKVVPL